MKLTDKQKIAKLQRRIRNKNKYIRELVAYAKELVLELEGTSRDDAVYCVRGGCLHILVGENAPTAESDEAACPCGGG